MNGRTIQLLASDVVDILSRWDIPDNFGGGGRGLDRSARKVSTFLRGYCDMAIGWRAARLFAQSKEMFPVYLDGDDHWVWRAYLMMCHPDIYADDDVAGARALCDGLMTKERGTVEALLLCEDMPVEEIAEFTRLPQGTVEAYEKLFYNVRDRFEDYLYLSRIVYPHGRLEEIYDNYLANATFGDLLRRVGYNSGKEFVAYMAGFRSNMVNAMSTSDVATQLERMTMANGFIWANSGALNQRSHAAGLRTAHNLLAAAKASGTDGGEASAFEDPSLASALRSELITSSQAGVSATVAATQPNYRGPILDADIIERADQAIPVG